MRRLIVIISSVVLISLFSGCGSKELNLPKFSLPVLDMSNLKLDKNMPTVGNLKIKSSLSEVALEWSPIRSKHIAGYRIFRNNQNGGFDLIKTIPDPYAAHYTDVNTNQRLLNRYKVSVYSDDGRVSVAKEIAIKKLAKPLAPLSYVNAVSGLPNRVKILWRVDPDERVAGYLIYRLEPQTKTWARLAKVDKRLSVEFIDRNVKPGVIYNYKVYAFDENGITSRASKVVSGSPKMLPATVTKVMATTNKARRIEIIWNPSPIADLDHYNIYASNFIDSLYSKIAQTRSTHFVDRFDEDGKIRFYSITAVDKDGLESLRSKPVKGMTLPPLLPPKITSAKVINNSVELRWEDRDKKAVKYNIYKSYWDGWRVKKVKISGFKAKTFLDPKIEANRKYTYYVTAVDKHGIESIKSRSIEVQVEGLSSKKKSWF